MFDKLKEYKSKHGNCNVPQRYKPIPRLGSWVMNLRKKKTALIGKRQEYEAPENAKSCTLTKERVDALSSLGFEWRLMSAKVSVSWEVRYQELIAYYQEHGRWPSRARDGELGLWVYNQRYAYAKKNGVFRNPVMLERIQKLNEIGKY